MGEVKEVLYLDSTGVDLGYYRRMDGIMSVKVKVESLTAVSSF